MTTILVVDDDLGFVVYLCLALTRAGYIAVPSTSVAAAKPLLQELGYSRFDLLIVNFSLTGTLGLLEGAGQSVKVIQIDDPRVTRIKRMPADGKLKKAAGPEGLSRWLRTVRRVLGEAA